MLDLYVNTGAPRNLGREDWVFRGWKWVRDTVANAGDVYAPTPLEAQQFQYKLKPVESAAYPPMPGTDEGTAGEVDGAGPSGGNATAVSEAEPASSTEPDVVNIDIYRIGESTWYELPNGVKYNGRAAALAALGVESDGD